MSSKFGLQKNEVSPGTFQLLSRLGLQTPTRELDTIEEEKSKYLPKQNNPRRLDYHFKLLLCAAHHLGGGG